MIFEDKKSLIINSLSNSSMYCVVLDFLKKIGEEKKWRRNFYT